MNTPHPPTSAATIAQRAVHFASRTRARWGSYLHPVCLCSRALRCHVKQGCYMCSKPRDHSPSPVGACTVTLIDRACSQHNWSSWETSSPSGLSLFIFHIARNDRCQFFRAVAFPISLCCRFCLSVVTNVHSMVCLSMPLSNNSRCNPSMAVGKDVRNLSRVISQQSEFLHQILHLTTEY